MKNQKRWLQSIVGALALLSIYSTAWATIPVDERLPAWDDYGTKTVDFTEINVISYRSRRNDTFISATSSRSSTFSLNSLNDGYEDVGFNGNLIIKARIGNDGEIKSGSFGIYSNDAMFTKLNTTKPDCNWGKKYCSDKHSKKKSKKHSDKHSDKHSKKQSKKHSDKHSNKQSKRQLVYGGDLLDFGWSGTQGIVEFEIGNLKGWAWDQWEVPLGRVGSESMEHLMLNVNSFDPNDSRILFGKANGFAVVPVPAAVWLFASGLIGLTGVARRKKRSV